MHTTKTILVIIFLLWCVPTAYGQDSNRIRYSTSMEISLLVTGGKYSKGINGFFIFRTSPAIEYAINSDIAVLLSPAIGIGKMADVFFDFLLQSSVRYWNDEIKPWYVFSGVSLIKPFSDRIRITRDEYRDGYYDTHVWLKNIHSIFGFGIHGSMLSAEFFWRCPMFPLIDGRDWYSRKEYYMILGAAVRVSI